MLDKEKDYYTWYMEVARRLRLLEAPLLDSIAEELEALGRAKATEIWRRMCIIHRQRLTLRPAGTPDAGTMKGWRESVIEARLAIEDLLIENPELRARFPEVHLQSYAGARELAVLDLGLKREDLPEKPPWTHRQLLDRRYWPKRRAK